MSSNRTVRGPAMLCALIAIQAALVLSAVFVAAWGGSEADGETSGQCGDDLYWTYDTATGALTITGSGDMYDQGSVMWGGNAIRSVSLPEGLTSIGDDAFNGCSQLRQVDVPAKVTSIGQGAFFQCYSLESAVLHEGLMSIGNNAFTCCSKLISVSIPSSVTSVGYKCFNSCHRLTSVTVPAALESLGDGAFANCDNLAVISVDGANQKYSSQDGVLFDKPKSTLIQYPVGKTDTAYSVPDTVRTIGGNAFESCTHLTEVTFPRGMTTIGSHAFEFCSGLSSVTFDAEITEIGYSAFRGTALVSVDIPEGVEIINLSTFWMCSSLKSVTIPVTVTKIDSGAFADCISLTSVHIPSGVTYVDTTAFSGCTSLAAIDVDEANQKYSSQDGVLLTKTGKALIYYPLGKADAEYTVPDTVETIVEQAFLGCTRLVSVTLPDGLTKISQTQFQDCASLESINIPSGVSDIQSCTFKSCSSLTNVAISEGVKNIKTNAFVDCSSLASLSLPGSIQNIAYQAFEGCGSLTEITVADSNANYRSIDGVLYSKDVTILVQYPASRPNTSYSLPQTVTYIQSLSFEGCRYLTQMTIPVGVTDMGDSVFLNCEALTQVTISAHVDTIKYRMFEGCTALTTVSIPSPVTQIQELQFCGCTSLKSFCIPASVESVSDRAFYGCTSLAEIDVDPASEYFTSVDGVLYNKDMTVLLVVPAGTRITELSIPESVEAIDTWAFHGCESLVSVHIPQAAELFLNTMSPFLGCTSLTAIDVDPQNPWMKSVDGVLFDSQGTTLIAYPSANSGTMYSVPAGVTEIRYEAFWGCGKLASVVIAESVVYMEDSAFDGCFSLDTIYYNAYGLDMSQKCWTFTDAILFIDANGGYVSGTDIGSPQKFPSAAAFVAPEGKMFKEYNTDHTGSGTSYHPGDRYKIAGKQTVYAIWDVGYSVTFDVQGHGSAPLAQTVVNGGLVTEPVAPTQSGYTFNGWYKDSDCLNAWNFGSDTVTSDTVLFAKWTQNTPPSSGINVTVLIGVAAAIAAIVLIGAQVLVSRQKI